MRVVAHIGLIKTGSTFLQSQVFSKYQEDILYVRNGNELISGKSMTKAHKNGVLISNEGMSGHPFITEELGLSYFDQFKNAVNNTVSFFKQPKIIVGFREPGSFLHSSFKQYLHEGGTMNWVLFKKKYFRSENFLNDFKFSRYIEYLHRTIPPKELYIYTFDDLKNRPFQLAEELTQFIFEGTNQEIKIPKINPEKKSNPSVPTEVEGLLIGLNKLNKFSKNHFGLSLQLRLGKKMINPRVLCQYLLPKIFHFQGKRDISFLIDFFESDWEECLHLINNHK